MAESTKAKAKGKKIGQNRRQPAKQRYTTQRRDDNRISKIRKEIAARLDMRRRAGVTAGEMYDFIDKSFPGWKFSFDSNDNLTITRDDSTKTYAPKVRY